MISRNPVTIQLRYLQTLAEVSNSQSSTIVFPLPIDVIQPLLASAQREGASPDGEQARLEDGRSAADGALLAAGGEPASVEPAPLDPASPDPVSAENPIMPQSGTRG